MRHQGKLNYPGWPQPKYIQFSFWSGSLIRLEILTGV